MENVSQPVCTSAFLTFPCTIDDVIYLSNAGVFGYEFCSDNIYNTGFGTTRCYVCMNGTASRSCLSRSYVWYLTGDVVWLVWLDLEGKERKGLRWG